MKKNILYFTSFLAAFLIASFYVGEKIESYDEALEIKGKLYPSDWGMMQRMYPLNKLNPESALEAVKAANILRKEQQFKLSKGEIMPAWQFAGPVNIGGRVSDIEFNPKDPNIVYAGISTGGVFKSTDMGNTWFPIFDDMAVFAIGDLGIDPNNPNVIYAGTGEANGGHNNFPGAGIFKSTDAGQTWAFSGLSKSYSIGRIIVNPNNSNIVYAAALGAYFAPNEERGIYKSTDAGASWNRILYVNDTTAAIDLIMKPGNPDCLMAAMWYRLRQPNSSVMSGYSGGIFITTNAGSNWTKSTSGLPSVPTGRIGLTVCNSNPNIVYSIFSDGYVYMGLYKTTNFGDSWVDADPSKNITSGTSNFGWYFGQIRVSPINPDIVYALDVAFMKSTDGGNLWPINYGYGFSGLYMLHVDHHALAFNPADPNYLISGNDGGINISTDGGVTWSNPKLLPCTQFYEIGLDYLKPERLYGGSQDNSTMRTTTGNINDWEIIWGGDGFYVSVDPTNSDIIYAESQYGDLNYSTDGGANFYSGLTGINYDDPRNWSTPVVIDQKNPKVLYYGTDKIYKSINGAQNWNAISPSLVVTPTGGKLGTVTTISVSLLNSDIIWAGTDDSQVWVTKDGGLNWINVSASLPNRWVTRVVTDPHDANTCYVTYSGLKWYDPLPHVFKTTDLGKTWIDITGNLPDAPVNALAVDLKKSNIIYVGTDVGAYVSFTGGNTWEVLGTGLPVVPVYDMKIHPVENYLAIGTHGRSMYKLDLNALAVDRNDNKPFSFALQQNYPNPFNPNTVIEFSLPSSENVELKIYNIKGEEVKTIVNSELSAGLHKYNISMQNLPSGVYLYRLKSETSSLTKKMILLK